MVAVREIRWTEESEDHIARHEVTPGEVEQVVNARPRLVVAGTEGSSTCSVQRTPAGTCSWSWSRLLTAATLW